MGPKDLTDDQQRILDLSLPYWEEKGSWPSPKEMMFLLKKEGRDHSAAKEDHFPPFWKRGRNGEIQPTLYGISTAAGGEKWTLPFLPLVRKGIDRFNADPRGKPSITDTDLVELSGGLDKDKLLKLGYAYREELSHIGGGPSQKQDGSWSVEITPDCLRFRQVNSLWEFESLSYQPVSFNKTVGPDQHQMLLWAYNKWRKDPQNHFDALEVILNNLDLLDPFSAWKDIPEGLFKNAKFNTQLDEAVTPFWDGLLALRPDSNEALQDTLKVLHAVFEEHFAIDGKDPELSRVAVRCDMDVPLLLEYLGIARTTG